MTGKKKQIVLLMKLISSANFILLKINALIQKKVISFIKDFIGE